MVAETAVLKREVQRRLGEIRRENPTLLQESVLAVRGDVALRRHEDVLPSRSAVALLRILDAGAWIPPANHAINMGKRNEAFPELGNFVIVQRDVTGSDSASTPTQGKDIVWVPSVPVPSKYSHTHIHIYIIIATGSRTNQGRMVIPSRVALSGKHGSYN